MNESVKRMIRDLNKYGSERKGDLSILVLSAADMIEELANKVDALEVGIPAEDWSRVRVKEYRQGQINILKSSKTIFTGRSQGSGRKCRGFRRNRDESQLKQKPFHR